MKLPPGTRIRFTKTIEDHGELGRIFATQGESGVITDHTSKEGYDVRTDGDRRWFGAERKEFEKADL